MGKSGNRFRLGFKAPPHLGIGGNVLSHDLDCDFAIQSQVARTVHLAHTSGTEGIQDFVLRKALTGLQ
jgi:hypothetical protein